MIRNCVRVIFVMVGLMGVSLKACDVPVYRYALERMEQEPYRVWCFSDGEETQEQAEIRQLLEGQWQRQDSFANVQFARIDIRASEKLTPQSFAGRVWESHRGEPLPLYVVLTPTGREIFAGGLQAEEAKRILFSPKREEIAKQLCDGKIVLLFLGSGDAEENKAAVEILRGARASAEEEGPAVALVQVGRSDPAEQWLVRQLLAVEDDLAEMDAPIVFPIIGRGRALPPYAGEGISEENVEELIMLLGGPCSCDLQIEQMGVDLLMDWNWEEAVARLMEGDEGLLPFELPGVSTPKTSSPIAEVKPPEAGFQSRIAWNLLLAVTALVIVVAAASLAIWKRSRR